MPSFIRLQDMADILIMTFLLYQLYSWFRQTRAIQVLLGLGVITLIYFVTRFLGLYMTSWVLQELGTVLIVLIIVVFQAEIRQVLYRFSLLRHLFDGRQDTRNDQFHEIGKTLFNLADKRTGAIIVFQRNESLLDLMLNGVQLDCEITPQILESIFYDGAPLHDGAALVVDGRIAQASCHLPLSTNPDLPQFLGTRHRAALGLSERTDAVVAVVSEERGEVSLAVSGELRQIATLKKLSVALNELINPIQEEPRKTVSRHLFSNLLPKTAILLMVTIAWALITIRQGQITTITVPVRLHGISDELALVRSTPEEVDVQLKSLSSLTPTPAKLDISADIDLSDIREGQSTVRIKNSDFKLPSGMTINSITPSSLKIVTEKKMSKSIPIKVMIRGKVPHALRNYAVLADPEKIRIEGPANQIERINSISTEEIDATRLTKRKEYRKNLIPPAKKGITLSDETVTIRLGIPPSSR